MIQTDTPPFAEHEEEWDPEGYCTHCGGDGVCYEASEPFGDCPESAQPCHACGGSGKRRDQTVF
jgi:DnaJ-class molecular chaperone